MILSISNINAYSLFDNLCFNCCHNPCECGIKSDSISFITRFNISDNGSISITTDSIVIPCEEDLKNTITLWERFRYWYWK